MADHCFGGPKVGEVRGLAAAVDGSVWMTGVTVTAADAGRRFAFDVDTLGVPISTWEYSFADGEDGCVVTERWTDRRPGWMRAASIVTGVRDRPAHNRRGMEETLAKLKVAAES